MISKFLIASLFSSLLTDVGEDNLFALLGVTSRARGIALGSDQRDAF